MRRTARLLVAFRWAVASILVGTAIAFVAPLGPDGTRLASDLAAVSTGLAMLFAFGWARHRSRGSDRLAWSILLFSTMIALGLYALDPVDAGSDRFPLAFRLGPIITMLHAGAMLLHARNIVRRVGLARLAVDAVWLGLGIVLIMGNGERLWLPDGLSQSTRLSLVGQQFTAAVMVALLGLLLHVACRGDRRVVLRLAGPVVLLGVAQGVAAFNFVHGSLEYGSLQDYLYTLAFGGVAVVALSASQQREPRPRTLAPGAGQLLVTWGPLAVWGAVASFTNSSVYEHDGWMELLVLGVGALRLSYLAAENNSLARRLHARTTRDPLTRLPNRRAIETLIGDSGGAHASLLLVDLDRFKSVNDTLGHSAGDELLRIVSDRMLDAVDSEWTVARLAGDEFVIVSTSSGDLEAAESMAARVVEAVSRPIDLAGREAWVGASVGVAVTDDDSDAHELLDIADYALRAAKKAARGEVVIADAELRSRARDRGSLEQALREGVDNDELRILYQPKVDLVTGRMVGVEALVRWERPGLGMVPPSDFIALAEATGLVARIDSWVLSTAVRDLGRWNADRCALPRLSLSTNMSAWQLARIDVDAEVRSVLADVGDVDPSQLTIELTETLLVEDPVIVGRRLRKLRETGVGIAIDDFGAGFTSISYLREFPVTQVKIDRDLIWELTGDERDNASLAAAVIALSGALELEVVAEGVETIEQAATLRRLGCRIAQGFLFERPVPAQRIDELVELAQPFDTASYREVGQG